MQSANHPRLLSAVAIGLAVCVIAAPIAAQQRDRPSRECMREVRELCSDGSARDRSQTRACLQERASELSSKCSAELQERIGARADRRGERATRPYIAPARVSRTVIFGDHGRQQVDVYAPADAVEPKPLVLFLHGGGWTMGSHKLVGAKPAHFGAEEYYFASAGYRLVPDAPVEDQAADIGAAIQALRGQADAIGFDPDRIVLMGHSSGAQLAALVATDPAFAGDAFAAIRGVILLDGAGYDIAAAFDGASPLEWQVFNTAFGSDSARYAAVSPLTHVGGADAPNWLALYVEQRSRSRDQSEAFIAALVEAGASADTVAISGTNHERMNRELGTAEGADQTQAIDAFLARIFES